MATGNHYLAAVKANQPTLYEGIQQSFAPVKTTTEVNKGHGRREKRIVSIGSFQAERFPDWPEAKTIIRVERTRTLRNRVEFETVYYISDLEESAEDFARRIRDYWKVENCVHYVRDVTFGEDRSRTRTGSLPILWAITRDLVINLYREAGFTNMARAKRFCGYGLKHLLALFRMK